jgi:hypothetical protein
MLSVNWEWKRPAGGTSKFPVEVAIDPDEQWPVMLRSSAEPGRVVAITVDPGRRIQPWVALSIS